MDEAGDFKTGFGVLCNGKLLVDVDPRNGGNDSFKKLCSYLGQDLKETAGLVVATGGGGLHLYYKHDGPPLKYKHDSYPGIEFKTSGFVVGYGSMHASGHNYEIARGDLDKISTAPEALIKLLERPKTYRKEYNGEQIEFPLSHLEELLDYYPNKDLEYVDWFNIGMALNHCTNGSDDGFEMWVDWSATSHKHDISKMHKKWHSLNKREIANPVTYGTLRYLAEENGYIEPVTFNPNEMVEATAGQTTEAESKPIAIDHIDITRPPGFVGRLATWINSRCRFPREKIAALAAITAAGCLAGPRYNDDQDATANLFSFCVSASATGKEAIQQAVEEILRVGGLGASIAGTIKSEQEIIRNLLTVSQNVYVIDEIGYFLSKVTKAQERGGATYLEGVIAILMSAYSKANGNLTIGMELRKDASAKLSAEIGALEQLKQANETYDEDRLELAKKLLIDLLQGFIHKPFLSLIGFTTPFTFDQIVNFENATNGFIGRSIVIREKDTNPKPKLNFKAQEMEMGLQLAIGRISNSTGEIKTSRTAQKALDDIQRYFFFELAEKQKDNGLEAISRRAFELVLKISLILAIDGGIRELIHVEYAFAVVLADISDKSNLAGANIAQSHKAKDEELFRRILDMLDYDQGITSGIIRNRLRKFKGEDVDKALMHLKDQGKIKFEQKNNQRGKSALEWFTTERDLSNII
jgi:hypothetical protein